MSVTGHIPRLRDVVLRVSITDRCNFRCRYCLPDGPSDRNAQRCLSLSQLIELVQFVAAQFSLRRLKITGGEPLVRSGVVGFVQQLASLDLAKISMTTNGSLLAGKAEQLKQAGLSRVNVSLDTLDADRFHALTRGKLADTLAGIEAAIACGLTPVKLNSVLRKSTWRDDVPALFDFAAHHDLELRFIELMPSGPAKSFAEEESIAADEIIDALHGFGDVQPLPSEPGTPARPSIVHWKQRDVRVGWITPFSQPFCESCNRLRLDSFGNLYRCLMDTKPFPLPGLLATHSGDVVHHLLRDYVNGKQVPSEMLTASGMASIGG